jgi:hypothetical protein
MIKPITASEVKEITRIHWKEGGGLDLSKRMDKIHHEFVKTAVDGMVEILEELIYEEKD